MSTESHNLAQTSGRTASASRFELDSIWAESRALRRVGASGRVGHLIFLAWRSILASPATALLSLFTTSVVLLLCGLGIGFFEVISSVAGGGGQNVAMRIFVKDDTQAPQVEELAQAMRGLLGIAEIRVIDKAAALKEFGEMLGEQEGLLEGLQTQNPLPASIEIPIAAHDSGRIQELVMREYAHHPVVEKIQFNESLAVKLRAVSGAMRGIGIFALLATIIMASFIIAITIRLAMYAHRQEIQIMRLVGATRWYMRIPFLIEGGAVGLLGSVISTIVFVLLWGWARPAISSSDIGQALGINLSGYPWIAILLLTTMGPILGILGSLFAVRRFSEEEGGL